MRHLLLVPTEPELRLLRPRLGLSASGHHPASRWTIALCGFGLVAAAARTAMLIAQHRPQQALLVGIAGALNDSAAIGSAYMFDRVICDGIGVGSDADYLAAAEIGWNQWAGDVPGQAIGDEIELVSQPNLAHAASGGALLSVCAASAHRQHAAQRQSRYPEALAEDMEGFGVAMACQLAGVPLRIVRGISNRAGDRNLAKWQIEESLTAAAELAGTLMAAVEQVQ
jgi:futalosine hydrolase